ncbi:MAG: hypothetical protein JWO22_1346 [Frankiales bacterium]|nr:hypothetical protein [Frankiales bacterium]
MNPNLMLDDDVLTRLLTEAAESFPVPEVELRNELPEKSQRVSRAVKWTAVAAALVGGVLVVQSFGGSSPIARTKQTAAALQRTKATQSAPEASFAPAVPTTSRNLLRSADGQSTSANTGTASGGVTFTGSPHAAAGLPALAPSSYSVKAAGPVAAAPSSAVAAPAPFDDGAKIVKTGSIALIVGDGKVGSLVVKVHSIAAAAGGYVGTEKSQEFGDDPTSSITIRVPVDRFEAVVQQVRDQVKNGVGKVDSASSSGQDVTASYSDVTAQIQSLTASRERFLVILGRANTIGETLSVQQRVDSVQQQIDSLKGRLKVLTDQTSMATLTVTVSEKAKAETKPQVQSGLSKSWDNAQHGFSSGVESLISRSGKGLLVLILAAVGLVILRTGWRLARRRLV